MPTKLKDTIEKSLIERVMQYLRQSECFDNYLPCTNKKKEL